MGPVQTQVEELPENRVRLQVEVPSNDVKHAIEHAASDLGESLRIPGFRKGKVPMQVLLARVGRDRLYAEAVESHIGGWFRNAAARTRIRPVASPEYGYELPASEQESFRFTATVAVQPTPEVADWTVLEVPAQDATVPDELIEHELRALQESAAELAPVEDRAAREGDTVVVDLLDGAGEGQRDLVVEVGAGRLVPSIDQALAGMGAGESKDIALPRDDGDAQTVTATVKEIKEKVLPPMDDELARSMSEYESLAELRGDIESVLRAQLEEEVESAFRSAAVDRLAEESGVDASGPLVDARTAELAQGFLSSLEARGIGVETYFRVTGETPEQLQERLREEARRSVARELVLEAVAEKLGLEVSDEELRSFIREQAELAEEDPDATVERIWASGRLEQLREDIRLRKALDRVAAETKRIPADLARAREKLWTPEQEKRPADTKLWTPGSKEPA